MGMKRYLCLLFACIAILAVFPLRPLQLILENRQQRSRNQEPQASLILRFLQRP